MAKNYYRILGIPADADGDEIKAAYRRLAKKYHPDHYAGDAGSFRDIHEAYQTLGDRRRRRVYDQRVVGPGPEPLRGSVRGGHPEPLRESPRRPPGSRRKPPPEPLIPTAARDVDIEFPVRPLELVIVVFRRRWS